MGLSQSQFAAKFGFPPATLRNWEQGLARLDGPMPVIILRDGNERHIRRTLKKVSGPPALNDYRLKAGRIHGD